MVKHEELLNFVQSIMLSRGFLIFSMALLYPQRNFRRHIVIALSVRPCVRPCVRPSVPLRVRCISPIFFEVRIPNLVCGCILG